MYLTFFFDLNQSPNMADCCAKCGKEANFRSTKGDTFCQKGCAEKFYGKRLGAPITENRVDELENRVKALEAIVFPSGSSSLTAPVFTPPTGKRIVLMDVDAYTPEARILNDLTSIIYNLQLLVPDKIILYNSGNIRLNDLQVGDTVILLVIVQTSRVPFSSQIDNAIAAVTRMTQNKPILLAAARVHPETKEPSEMLQGSPVRNTLIKGGKIFKIGRTVSLEFQEWFTEGERQELQRVLTM